MLFRLLPYHLRLAAKGLRRDPGLSATIVVVMGVAAGIFCTSIMHYLRIYGPRTPLSPTLHQVEIAGDRDSLEKGLQGSSAAISILAARTRVSFPNYQILSQSGIPTREAANYRTCLLVSAVQPQPGATGQQPRTRNARFVNADFFAMFPRRFRWGAPWSRADEAAGLRMVVLGREMNARLFSGGDSVGRTVMVEGRPFRVAGVLANHQPFVPEWDIAASGGSQDAIYLPFPEYRRLRAWPETLIHSSPMGSGFRDLLVSDAAFVSYWLELPTVAVRQAYADYLAAHFGVRGISYTLRDIAALRNDVPFPGSAISFFALLTLIVLVGGGLIMTRLLLAKGLAHGDELGIFRAIGAPRRALFVRQMIEGLMLSILAACLSITLAVPQARFYNTAVGDTDIPLQFTGLELVVTFAATLVIGILASVYPAWRISVRRPTVALERR